jgi:ATP-binding cassette subfamily F protein 3
MQRLAPAHVDSPFEFSFAAPAKLPRPLLALERQAAGYAGCAILEQVSLTLAPGDRVALLGRNGAGKSTLMKLLAGTLPALAGARTEARDLRIGYFAQHQLEQLSAHLSPFAHLQRMDEAVRGEGAARSPEQSLRDFLAGFGFRGERVFEPVAPFSGGEKARLALALVAYQRPNLLLLDEPTNHLDLEMRQALSVALQDYDGAVVLVSHDRHLLSTVADQLVLVQAGAAQAFGGDLDDYARWLATSARPAPASAAAMPPPLAPAPPGAVPESAEARRRRRQVEAEQRARRRPLQSAIAEHERELERLLAARTQIEAELTDPRLAASAARSRLTELLKEQARLSNAIEAVEADWMQASERLEACR